MCSFLFFSTLPQKRIVCAGMLTPDAEISFFGNYSTSFCMVRLTRILQAYTWGRTCTCTTHQKTHAQSCMCDGHRAWCFAVIPAVADDDEWDFLRWRYVCESVCGSGIGDRPSSDKDMCGRDLCTSTCILCTCFSSARRVVCSEVVLLLLFIFLLMFPSRRLFNAAAIQSRSWGTSRKI